MELLTPDYGLIVFMLLILLPVIGLWIAAIASIVRNRFQNRSDKTLWLIIVIFFPLIGSLLYFVLGTKQIIKQ